MALLNPNAPALPASEPAFDMAAALENCWIMYYRHGMNPQLTKGFYFTPDPSDRRSILQQVVERAQKHCEVMGYKYNWVRQMVTNLDIQEGIQLGTIDSRTLKPREARSDPNAIT